MSEKTLKPPLFLFSPYDLAPRLNGILIGFVPMMSRKWKDDLQKEFNHGRIMAAIRVVRRNVAFIHPLFGGLEVNRLFEKRKKTALTGRRPLLQRRCCFRKALGFHLFFVWNVRFALGGPLTAREKTTGRKRRVCFSLGSTGIPLGRRLFLKELTQ